jgi:hypothetical protein
MSARVPRALAVLSFVLASTASARADEPEPPREDLDPAALFRGGLDALAGQRPNEAIAKLEALGDRGVVDAVVSFDRGLAYAARVRSGAGQAGDLGRAAHGFEEARDLTHDGSLAREASGALAAVRSEVAKRRSRAGDPVEIEHGFSLGRSIVEVLPENAWAGLAAALSLALSASLVVRRLAKVGRAKVAATTAAGIAGALLALTSLLAWAARDARLNLREGVVVVPSARLLDNRHLTLDGSPPLPEGARVRILEESGGYSRIKLGGAEGLLPSSAVLPLAKR